MPGGGGFGYFEFALVGHSARHRRHRRSSCSSASGCCRSARAGRCRPTSAGMPARWSSSTASATACTSCASARTRPCRHRPRRHRPRRDPGSGSSPSSRLQERRSGGAPMRRDAIAEGDLLVVRGDAGGGGRARAELGLAFATRTMPEGACRDRLFNRNSGLAEVHDPAALAADRRAVFPGMVTAERRPDRAGDAAAGRRPGARASRSPRATPCCCRAPGRRSTPARAARGAGGELARSRPPPGGAHGARARRRRSSSWRRWWSCWRPGSCPAAVAGLLAAGAILLSGILTVEEIYRAINWTTVILVGAMMPLSTAIAETGAAQLLADGLVEPRGRRRARGRCWPGSSC